MNLKKIIGWILAAFFVLMGVVIYTCFVGYSFSAYICFALAALFSVYQLLHLLSTHHKRAAGILRILLTVFLCLGIIAASVTGIYIAKTAFAAPAPDCQYMVVLGAGLHGSVPSLTLSDRLNAAADYLNSNPETVCVVSGGQGPGEAMTEAQCMYEILLNKGISPDRIWMEDRSTSTYENLTFSLALIREKTGTEPTKLGILSSEYHLFRACQTAKALGIEPEGIPAPTSMVSLFLNYFLREIPAVWYYMIFGG